MKHINILYNFIKDANKEQILLKMIHTLENPVDMLIKPVTVEKSKHCLDIILT